MVTKEEWKSIENITGYEISNLGRIRSWKKPGGGISNLPRSSPKIIKLQLNPNKYLGVSLSLNGKRINTLAHRLVLEAFIWPCPKGMWASHLNGNKLDNRLCNLIWETPIENHHRKIMHGTYLKGELCHSSKLSEKQVIEIRKMLIETRMSEYEIASLFNVTHKSINSIKTGETWKHLKSHYLKAKQRKWATARGTRSYTNKLTEAQVIHIYKSSEKNAANQMADFYGVHRSTIHSIRSGGTWEWLTQKKRGKRPAPA